VKSCGQPQCAPLAAICGRVKEGKLVKITSASILLSLLLTALLVAEPAALAQQPPAQTDPPVSTATFAETGLPAGVEPTGGAIALDGPLDLGSSSSLPPEMLADQTVFLDGGTWGQCELDPCCAVCGGGDWCPPCWYTRQEVQILARGLPRRTMTTTELVLTGGFSVLEKRLTSRSVPFDVAAGYSTLLGHYLGRDTENRDRFLEFTYWGLNDWSESRLVTGGRFTDSSTFVDPVNFGSLFSPFSPTDDIYDSPVGGFNRADQHWIRYESDIDNFELNLRFRPRTRSDRLVLHPNGKWRRQCRPGRYFSYLFGARVLTIDELFELQSRGDITVGAVSNEVSGDYLTRTCNNLVGFQIGAELIQRECKYNWGFSAKAGPYINIAKNRIRAVNDAINDPFATIPIDFEHTAAKDEVAFIGEVGAVGTYRIRPNLILRASYDLIWVVGLAMAPDQLDFGLDPPGYLNTNATAFYHGLSLGFEWIR
jgi:hypothetical protein